ncbi:hypothetical protein BDC45DRAFT_533798 [Circinella umbellata]|nr:hypothetical protein BDC45DRAFT_533798 [Circinella umbellata]
MGKATKNKVSTKFQTSASNISKHVTSKQPNAEPTNAKERLEQELGLLHVRKQAIHMNHTPGDTMTHKVKKKATMKRSANARQQKKIARALLIADKEETKLEKQNEKAEMKKLRKNIWS